MIKPYVGRRVGPYRLVGRLANGGTCTLWRARHSATGKPGIIKLLDHEISADAGWRARLRREAEVLRILETAPDVVRLIESGQSSFGPYICMEEVHGLDLGRRPKQRMSLNEAFDITCQLLVILENLHGHGIVHGDIKPGNLMKMGDGRIVLIDFSLANPVGRRGFECNLTHDPNGLGTPGFCSPEQHLGRRIDGRSDLFSVGCLLWNLLTGKAPFWNASTEAIWERSSRGGYPSPAYRWPKSVPTELQPFFAKALARRPQDRFISASAMRLALEAHSLPRSA